MKLTEDQLAEVKGDIFTICHWFNDIRNQSNLYMAKHGLNAKAKEIDPYFLFAGGSELTKQFHKDWQLASKIASAKGLLKVMCYVNADSDGCNLKIFGEASEEVSKAFLWVPGIPIPNKWTGNRHSQTKESNTLLLSFGCNVDGTIRQCWASFVQLSNNPDGKTGDWTFTANAINSSFSSFQLTQEVFLRPSYQQVIGDLEMEYCLNGDAKKGMLLLLEKIHQSNVIVPA